MNNFSLERTEILKTVSTDWNFLEDGDAEILENNMINFMLDNNGIGLAANQISIAKRIFVMGSYNNSQFPAPFALFNPRITEASKNLVLDTEGCLSYPGVWLTVKRPSWIIGSYQDSKGIERNIRLENYAAKCFQHELDHLDGICFVDKVSRMKLKLAMKKLRKK